jgi:hypothetical protein
LLGVVLAMVVLSCVLSCAFEFRPPSAFNGSYELEQGCTLDVEEVQASASCAQSGTTVQVSVEDERVVFDNVVLTETETHTECWKERVCKKTYTGTMVRKKRELTPYDGRFSQLGGEWEGSLSLKVKCDKQIAQQNAPAWCKGGARDTVYTVKAKVGAHDAEITWSAESGASGDFKALETKGGVRVADQFYRRVGP